MRRKIHIIEKKKKVKRQVRRDLYKKIVEKRSEQLII